MLAQKTNKNKNLILELVLGLIVLIIVFLLLKSLVFKTGGEDGNGDLTLNTYSSPEKFDPLDVSIFNDPKFEALKDNSSEEVNVEDLDIGKENPFSGK